MSEERSIELDVEVAGSVEQAWTAIATGPGMSSWYVPHTIEEREGGAANASFGPGMDVAGKVTAWDPPHRIKFEGVEEGPGLTFEWLVEPLTDSTSTVRLVNGGFGTGTEWDGSYNAMTEGWKLFMTMLQLHCEHFADQAATASLPMGMWAETPETAWARASESFGFDAAPAPGDQIEISATDAPSVSGTVQMTGPTRIAFMTTTPTPGHGFITAEDQGGSTAVSVWLYLYGDDAPAASEAHQSAWMKVLNPE